MAHKKGVGSSRNGRDSNSQRLGLKKFGGENVLGGNILARQRDPGPPATIMTPAAPASCSVE